MSDIQSDPIDILQQCLDQLERGELTLDEAIAMYPDLRPMLQAANHLASMPPVEISPAVANMMEARIFEQAMLPAKAATTGLTGLTTTLVAGLMILTLAIGGAWMLSRDNSSDDTAALQQQILNQQATIAALQSQIAASQNESDATEQPIIDEATEAATEAPTEPPTIEESESNAPQTSASEDLLPVLVKITGMVQEIDEEAGAMLVAGVVIQTDFTLLPDDFSPQDSPLLTVTGDLLDDGVIVASEIETPAPETPSTISHADITCDAERCHPVLVILSAAYETRYDELDALHQSGFGIGEVARMLAIADGANVALESVQSQRESGASWGQIMQSYPDVSPAEFAPGRTIGAANRSQNAGGNSGNGNSGAPGNSGNGNGNSGGNGGPPAGNPNPNSGGGNASGGGPPADNPNPGRGNN